MDKSLKAPYKPSGRLLYSEKDIKEIEAYKIPLVSEIKKLSNCKKDFHKKPSIENIS
jgi:hypothetical protein